MSVIEVCTRDRGGSCGGVLGKGIKPDGKGGTLSMAAGVLMQSVARERTQCVPSVTVGCRKMSKVCFPGDCGG